MTLPTEPMMLVPEGPLESSALSPGSRPTVQPGQTTEISDRELAANVAQMRKLMGLGAILTLVFTFFDVFGVRLNNVNQAKGTWIPRLFIALAAGWIWFRLRRPKVSAAWVDGANVTFFVWASIQTAVICSQSGGFKSTAVDAVLLALIGQTFLQPVSWGKGLLRQGATIVVFVVSMLVLSGLVPEMGEQLHDPDARAEFKSEMIGLLTAWLLLVAGGHSFWVTRRKFIETRTAGRYVLKRRIAAGGMGDVWSAYHPAMKREVAVKILRQDCLSPGMLARFEREIMAMTRLSHPNTVRVLDCGTTDDGLAYYVMELIPGETLKQLVEREGPLSVARAVHIARQATRALAEAHAFGIVHRDIKPSNLLITSTGGESDFVKVVDFGVAKHGGIISSEHTDLTNAGMVVGTPAYMSPEQASAGEVDARSDVYALGAVLFFALTGRPPFTGPQEALLLAHRSEIAPLLSAVCPHMVAPALDRVVRTCLAKDPARRFASALDLDAALAELPQSDEDAPWSPIPLQPPSSGGRSVDRDRATVRPGTDDPAVPANDSPLRLLSNAPDYRSEPPLVDAPRVTGVVPRSAPDFPRHGSDRPRRGSERPRFTSEGPCFTSEGPRLPAEGPRLSLEVPREVASLPPRDKQPDPAQTVPDRSSERVKEIASLRPKMRPEQTSLPPTVRAQR